MSTTVTTVLTDHTWDTASASWDEMGFLGKTWDGAVIINTTLTANELVAFLEARQSAISEVIAEALGLSDAPSKHFTANEAEIFALLDAANTITSFMPVVYEALGFADAESCDISARLAETLATADRLSKAFSAVAFESLTTADLFDRLITYGILIAESLGVDEGFANNAGKAFSEVFSAIDSAMRSAGLVASESLSVAEQFARLASFIVAFQELVQIEELEGSGIGKPFAEQLSVDDDYARTVQFLINFAELLSLSESYQDNINFMMLIMEAVSIADTHSLSQGKPFTSSFAIAEADAIGVGSNQEEQVSFQEALRFEALAAYYETVGFEEMTPKEIAQMQREVLQARDALRSSVVSSQVDSFAIDEAFSRTANFIAKFAEVAAFQDAISKQLNRPVSEVIRVAEARRSQISAAAFETLAVMDVIGRIVEYNRSYSENFQTSEAVRRAAGLGIKEAIALADEYLRPGVGVYNQAELYSRALSDSEFKALLLGDSPQGFGPFRQFVPGDYEYQEAIVRAALSSRDTDRAAITELSVEIDVEDVIERGSFTFTTAGAQRIQFNRKFIVPPEVTITTKAGVAGVVAIPKIIGQVQRTHFDVVLENTSGQAVTGAISWSAVAY